MKNLTLVLLAIVTFMSCEDDYVTPMQPEAEVLEEVVQVETINELDTLLIGSWQELESSKDSLTLTFDGESCHFYSLSGENLFDFTIDYSIDSYQITFEENKYLLHDVSTIEVLDKDNFIMTTSHLVDNSWVFTDVQHFARIK